MLVTGGSVRTDRKCTATLICYLPAVLVAQLPRVLHIVAVVVARLSRSICRKVISLRVQGVTADHMNVQLRVWGIARVILGLDTNLFFQGEPRTHDADHVRDLQCRWTLRQELSM